jgi:hypothetical protein
MKLLLVLVVLCAYVYAQKPTPCTTPPQWDAYLYEYNVKENFQLRAKFTYDAIYKRERIIEQYSLGQDREAYDVLRLNNQNVEYVYSFKYKNCTTRQITRPWRDFGIPANATSYGEAYIGSSAVPNANVLATLWGANFTDPQGNQVYYSGAWTYEACLPISSTYYGESFGLTHVSFYDITPGISDPSVFIPRRECLA